MLGKSANAAKERKKERVTHTVDETDACKVHVLSGELVEDFLIMDRFRLKVLVILQLRTTE
jgi:hypothetical protein